MTPPGSESEKCTARDPCIAATGSLFDHLVGASKKCRWNFEAERLRGLEIDDEIEFDWLRDREVRRRCALENLVNIRGGASYQIGDGRAITHQSAGFCI